MKIAVIDNYDSFVYTIIHYLEGIDDVEIVLMKNDQVDWEVLEKIDRIVLSPGPGVPSEAGDLLEVIQRFYTSKPILGVCLGHQAIGEFFGARLKNLDDPLHGFVSPMNKILEDTLWNAIEFPTTIGHYHSWVVDANDFPEELEVLSVDSDSNIMALKHSYYPIKGIQFHPESVLTPDGRKMLENWVRF